MRPGSVEMRNKFRLFRHADIEQIETGGRQSNALCLIRDCHHVVDHVERIRAHFGVRQLGLRDDARRMRVGHIHAGEILRSRLMRKPQDAAPIARELHRHAFADSAKALQLVMGKQTHVE